MSRALARIGLSHVQCVHGRSHGRALKTRRSNAKMKHFSICPNEEGYLHRVRARG